MATIKQFAENATALTSANSLLVNAFLVLKSAVPTGTVLSAEDQSAVDTADALVVNAKSLTESALNPVSKAN